MADASSFSCAVRQHQIVRARLFGCNQRCKIHMHFLLKHVRQLGCIRCTVVFFTVLRRGFMYCYCLIDNLTQAIAWIQNAGVVYCVCELCKPLSLDLWYIITLTLCVYSLAAVSGDWLAIALSQPHASLRSEPPRASRTTLTF